MFKNKKNIKNYLALLVLISVLFLPSLVAFAAEAGTGTVEGGTGGGGNKNIIIKNPFKQDTIPGLIKVIIDEILIPIGSVVAVLMIMYAGFQYVTARGDAAKITKAKDALLWAVIGAAILLGAWVLAQAIQGTIDQLRA